MSVAEMYEWMCKARDEIVDQRLLAREEELVKQSMPIVAMLDKLVFEEVDKRSLVPGDRLSARICVSPISPH